ncbi:ppGpp synthetase/RelA/SpoT-type nucleotidyltransferase [Variovorax sp. W2I14]
MPIPNEMQQSMAAAYRSNNLLYKEYANLVSGLVGTFLESRGISIHSVVFRSKTPESLVEKIARPEKTYTSLKILQIWLEFGLLRILQMM